jgi:cell shape-determining protein MreC
MSMRQEWALGGGANVFSVFSSNAALAADNRALRAELASTSVLLADRDILLRENAMLKERFNRPASSTHTVLAAVILRPPGIPYDTLMLDAGSNEGIAVGDLVSAGGSVYIGKISQVYAVASRVTLFSAPGEEHDALLLTASTTAGTPLSLAGQGGGSFTGQVPAGTPVNVGDKALLPNLGIQFIATVTAVDTAAEKSFKTVYLSLPVNPLSLRFVEVRRAGTQP